MIYEHREVILIPFPYSDLSGAKQRPALIISNDKLNKTDDLICCLITSKKQKNNLLIAAKSLERGRLPFKSWVKPQRIFTIDKKIIRKKLCLISGDFYDKVLKEIVSFLKRN